MKHCLTCFYPLDALHEARCPECGQSFDPGDPTTYDTGEPAPPPPRSLRRIHTAIMLWPVYLLGSVYLGAASAFDVLALLSLAALPASLGMPIVVWSCIPGLPLRWPAVRTGMAALLWTASFAIAALDPFGILASVYD